MNIGTLCGSGGSKQKNKDSCLSKEKDDKRQKGGSAREKIPCTELRGTQPCEGSIKWLGREVSAAESVRRARDDLKKKNKLIDEEKREA